MARRRIPVFTNHGRVTYVEYKYRQKTTHRSFRVKPAARAAPLSFRTELKTYGPRPGHFSSRKQGHGSVGKAFSGAMTQAMGGAFHAVAQRIAFAFYNNTPIDTGYARSRWQIRQARGGKAYFIDNDAWYIGRLENGGPVRLRSELGGRYAAVKGRGSFEMSFRSVVEHLIRRQVG